MQTFSGCRLSLLLHDVFKGFFVKKVQKGIQNSIFDKKAQPTHNSFCVTISPTLTRDTNTLERTWEEPPSLISDGYLVASNRENQNQYNWKFETISNSVGTSYLTSSARNQQLHQAAELKTKLLSWPPLLGRRQSNWASGGIEKKQNIFLI